MVYKKLVDYYNYILSTIHATETIEHTWHPIDFKTHKDNKIATIGTDPEKPLIFKQDRAHLTFYEEYEIIDEHVSRREYSINYSNNTLTFRYDKDPKESYPEHALRHLHINDQDKPRLITHETSFEEILDFLNATYYDERSKDGRKPRS